MALSNSILEKIKQDKENKKNGVKDDNSSKNVEEGQGSKSSSPGSNTSTTIRDRVAMDLTLKKLGFTHNRENGLLNDSRYENYYNAISTVDQKYFDSFTSDWNSYANRLKTAYEGMNWKSAQTWGQDKELDDAGKDLMFRSAVIRTYLDSHKDDLDEDSYKGLVSELEGIQKSKREYDSAFSQAKQYYSQWDTEEDYNKYLQEQKEYEDLLNYDLDAGEKEVKALEALLDEYDRLVVRQSTANPESEANVRLREIRSQYGSKEDIEALLSEKNAYLNRAKHIQEGVTLSGVVTNADFDANSGYVSTESDNWWSKLTSDYGMGYDDLTYEYINGAENGMRDEIKQKYRSYSSDSGSDGESIYEERGYDHLTEDEIAIYNYYYSKDGKEAAEKYLDSIQETLSHRKATSLYENMEDKTLLELAFGVAAGLDQFESGVKNLFNTKDDYIPATATQMASGMVREDLADDGFKLPDWLGGASIGQAAYDTITTTANMAPSMLSSIAANMIVPGSGAYVGNAMMFASSAGNAYQEALNRGYDKSQARAYSTLVGASEAGLQYLLGGISSLGGKASGSVLSKMLDGIDNAFARTALKVGGNMLSEGFEEGLQEVITPLFKNWALKADEDINWSEVAYSGLLGALTAGLMEGPTTIAGEVKTYKTGKSLQAADISAQRLAEIGKTFSADTVAYQLAGRVNENTGAYTMGRLFNEIGATLSEQNVSEITNALVAKGMDERIAKKNAEALAYVVEGGQLSERQIAVIEANEVLAEVARTTLIDANTTWNQRSQGYNEMLKALADEMTSPKASRTKVAQQGEVNTPTSDTVDTQKENGTESLSEADSVDTSPAKVQSISTIKDGKATIKLEDGSEVDVKKADLDPDDGVRIETIAGIEGISAEDANFVLDTLRISTNASAQMDSLGAKEAYKYGFYGFSQEHMTTHGVFANSLTDAQRQAIYETGKKARQQQIENATLKKGTGISRQSEIYFDAGSGKVEKFTDAKKMSTMTDKQKVGVQAAMILRKLGIGGDIYFFESYRNSKGQLVYKDKNGNEVKAPNGWYDQDGSIHIDLNAGAKGQGFILFTLAHELTHFIEQWSPQKYKILADFLVENYEKGQSMDKLVRAKQAKLSALRGKKITYREAYSEVVADSMEAMLADSNVMDKLLELKAKDNGLFMKMKHFFDNLLAKIRNIYKGQTPDSAEGRAVLEMTESIEKIQQLFADALVDASENFQSAEKITTNDGGVMYMSRDIADVTEDTVRADLADVFNGNNVTAMSYIPLAQTTPFAVRYITGYTDDRPVIVEKKKAYFDMRGEGKFKEDKSHHYHGMGIDGFLDALEILNDPEFAILEDMGNGQYHYAFISSNENGEELCVVFQMNVTKSVGQMNGYPGGYYNLDITEFVATDEWLEAHGVEPGTSYKDYLLSFPGNSIAYDRSIHFEQLEKARIIDSESAGLAASYDNNRASEDKLTQPGTVVKPETVETLVDSGIAVDSDTDSGSIFSVRDVLDDAERKNVAKALVDRFGVTEKEAMEWLKAETSLASLILNPKYSSYLDYAADPNEVAIKQNSDYPQGTVDFSNICKKRREFTQVMNRILRNFPNHVFAATDLAKIRTIMGEEGMTLPCGICYVEDRRQLDTIVAQDFIDGLKLYREGSKTRPDGKPFNANQLKGLQLTDGDTYVPTIYELVSLEGRNSLKAKNPNMEAAWVRYNNARGMQSVRLLTNEAEYKRQILKYNKNTVKSKNDKGGLRIYSFSDAEMFHLIDIIQVITDSAAVGLYLQGYTKVNEYAKAVKDTGEKLNRSLIPLGDLGYHMENGKVVLDYDTVEGIDIYHEDFFDNKNNPNVGNITIGINDIQIRAAMVSDFVDQIIPFHTGQSEEVLGEKGIAAWNNYKDFQTEKDLATGKTSNHQVNIYTEVIQAAEQEGKPIQNKRQFVEKFLQVCKENGLQPRFSQFLNTDAQGNYIYTEGYHKFLVDFKTFAQTKVGEYLPQGPVKPIFDDAYITGLLKAYVKEQKAKDADVAKQMPKVIERITNEIIKPTEVQRSDRDSDGNQLSTEQQEFFKDSKARDKKGNLLRLYHGSNYRVTKFNPMFSDDKTSLFMTDKFDVAASYTRRYRELNPYEYIDDDATVKELLEAAEKFVFGKYNLQAVSKSEIEEAVAQVIPKMPSIIEKLNNISQKLNDSNLRNTFGARGLSRNMYTAMTTLGSNPVKSDYEKLLSQNIGYDHWLAVVADSVESFIAFDGFSFVHADIEEVVQEIGSIRAEAALIHEKVASGNGSVFRYEDNLGKTAFISETMLRKEINWATTGGILPVYANITNPFVVEAKGRRWNNIATPTEMRSFHDHDVTNTRTVAAYAKANGYDGVIFKGLVDMGGDSTQKSQRSTIVIAFDGTQMKSTMNKTPTTDPDIRYSDRDSDGTQLTEDQQEFFENSKARDENGNLYVMYHGSRSPLFTEFDMYEGVWLTPDQRYAEVYAEMWHTWRDEDQERTGLEQSVYADPDYRLYKMYANITNPLDLGEINDEFDRSQMNRLARLLGVPTSRIRNISHHDGYQTVGFVYEVTKDHEFIEIAKEKGYDGFTATEKGRKTFCAFASPNQVKLTTNEVPSGFSDIRYSERVTDEDTLDFLNKQIENGEYITVYRSFQVIDGGLYAPMNAVDRDEDGKNKRLGYRSELGKWEKATESPEIAQRYMDKHPNAKWASFDLDGVDNKTSGVAYNPYLHASNLVLNDQFSAAYRRSLVTVECRVPLSEVGAYHAKYAKDTTGWVEWKPGGVAGKLMKVKPEYTRKLFVSRYMLPVRIISDSEVAQMYKEYLDGTNIQVPWNVVTPSLRKELVKAGVSISYKDVKGSNYTRVFSEIFPDDASEAVRYSDRDTDSVSNRSLLANAFEDLAQNEMEKNKIQEYKGKISLINAEEQKLSELNEKIKELSFSKGPRDTKAIRDLQFEARQTANRINVYDKQLLRLEASKPLQDVLTREKKMAYKRAEQKGKEALEAYREKTMKTQRELLEKWQTSRKKGIESRHKTAMRHKIKDVVNELNQYLLRGTKDRHVPIELQKAVAEALDAVNMDTVGAEERIAKLKDELLKAKTPEQIQEISRKIDHIQEMGDKMNGRLQKLKNAYDQFVNSDDPLIANSHDEVISNKLQSVIETVGDTPLRDMTLSQLEDVYDMYRMVLTTIRNANKAFKAKKSKSISIIANQVMEEVERVGGKKKLVMKGMDGIKSFGWNNLKPVYAFEHIGSDHFTEVFNNVRDGEDIWALDVTEARDFYLDKSKKYNYDSWDFKKRYMFTSTSGMNFELTLEQIMSLYAYSKRDQAADHLKKGGIVIDETTEITVKNKLGIPVKFNPTEATAYNISEETLANIISKLTNEQQSFVDEMQDYLSVVMGAKGNEVSLVMYGVKLFKEKFYFPLKSAHQFMAKAKEQAQGEVKIKNSGFSKETVQKASNPIVLTPFMNVWANHVNEMSMYHAFVLPMEDFYRVYNYKTPTSDTMATESVEMFIQNAYGKGATKYIDQLLKDLNGGARTDSTTGIINKMMGLFKKGAVFASLSVVVQQPSAIARAAALVDTKYFIGPNVDHKRHKALWNEVKQYAPVAIIKEMGYFDTNMGKSTQDFIMAKEYSGFSEKMKALVTDSGYRDEALSKAPALADELAWCGIWEAVKRETKAKNPGMDTKSEEFLKKAGERFTEVITKTQVYDSVLSRSALMRSKDTGMKMATSFMAEPTTSINMVADALLKGKRGNKKYARAAIGAVIASQILNSILVSFVYAGRDDDENETYLEKYIGTLTGEVLDSLNPAGYVPFIKDIMSIVQGYDVERSDMSVISDLWNAWQNLSKDNVSVYRKVEGFAGSIAQIFGLPVKNIMRDVRGIYQTIDSFVNGEITTKTGIGYAVKSAIPEWMGGGDVSNQEQLYQAYMRGDKAQIARVEGRYKDQAAINSAMRSVIKEHLAAGDIDADAAMNYLMEICGDDENEAFWKVEEWKYESKFEEDFGKYNEFYGAVKTGKDLKAIIKKYTDNGVTMETLKTQITSHFKPLYIEMSNSEKAGIKGYLLNAMTLLGEAREKAEERIKEWEFEGKHGFTYDDRKQQYMEGNISASEMKSIIMEVEGKTEEEASSRIVSYTRDAYEDGYFTRSEATTAMVTYGGLTKEEAESKLQYIDVKKQFPDTYVDDAWVDEYYAEVQSFGISIEVFVDYRNKVKGITGEGKKEGRMAVIDSMPISNAQKDALYYAEGWAASKLYEAPWH